MTLTCGAAVEEAAYRLRQAGVADARRDARLLLADLLESDVASVMAWPERPLDRSTATAFEARVARRAGREPISRIRGTREFWSLPFRLVPETLDPRPDSEVLITALLEHVEEREASLRVLDLGTGSGCLLLAMLAELPRATGVGVDCSESVLAAAGENAEKLGLGARAEFRLGHWADGIDERFDLLLCNPPYIPGREIASLEPEVARWEPRAALDGGADGLDPYREIFPTLARLMSPGGKAVFEHGPGQGKALTALLRCFGRWQANAVYDLAGRERALLLTSPCS